MPAAVATAAVVAGVAAMATAMVTAMAAATTTERGSAKIARGKQATAKVKRRIRKAQHNN
jgi:hypothetical protein